MERPTAESQLIEPSSARFALATQEHDFAIRTLLRDNSLPGPVSLSFEREPSYFTGANLAGGHDETIVALEEKRLVCLGRCSTRSRYVNGRICRVGYLAELRLDKGAAGRFDILRRGYKFFRKLQEKAPADFYFSSISSDNERSIRFLERGLPGMPVYKFLTQFSTFLIAVPRRPSPSALSKADNAFAAHGLGHAAGTAVSPSSIADFLNDCSSHSQLAATWSSEQLSSLIASGLCADNFHCLMKGNRMVGCAALWDQRSFRQIVIRDYEPKLRMARPLINRAAKFFNLPHLPEVKSVLSQAFLSPLALETKYETLLPHLVARALVKASAQGIDYVTVGLESKDRRAHLIRKHFRCREYKWRLYQVMWPDHGACQPIEDRPFCPEVAFL